MKLTDMWGSDANITHKSVLKLIDEQLLLSQKPAIIYQEDEIKSLFRKTIHMKNELPLIEESKKIHLIPAIATIEELMKISYEDYGQEEFKKVRGSIKLLETFEFLDNIPEEEIEDSLKTVTEPKFF